MTHIDESTNVHDVISDVAGEGTAQKVEGSAHQVVGKVKEVAGNVSGDKELKAEGQVEQAEGKVQHLIGQVIDVAETAVGAVVEGSHKLIDTIKHPHHKE